VESPERVYAAIGYQPEVLRDASVTVGIPWLRYGRVRALRGFSFNGNLRRAHCRTADTLSPPGRVSDVTVPEYGTRPANNPRRSPAKSKMGVCWAASSSQRKTGRWQLVLGETIFARELFTPTATLNLFCRNSSAQSGRWVARLRYHRRSGNGDQ